MCMQLDVVVDEMSALVISIYQHGCHHCYRYSTCLNTEIFLDLSHVEKQPPGLNQVIYDVV